MADDKNPLLEKTEAGRDEETTIIVESHGRSVRPILDTYFRRILPASVFVLILWSLVRAAFIQNHHWCPGRRIQSKETLVPLEAHIMSKCPDAKDCLEKLVVPSMVNISDKVNFTLSYIGRYGVRFNPPSLASDLL